MRVRRMRGNGLRIFCVERLITHWFGVGLRPASYKLAASIGKIKPGMSDLEMTILSAVQRPGYQPLKPKALARKLGVPPGLHAVFKTTLKKLINSGRVELGK